MCRIPYHVAADRVRDMDSQQQFELLNNQTQDRLWQEFLADQDDSEKFAAWIEGRSLDIYEMEMVQNYQEGP